MPGILVFLEKVLDIKNACAIISVMEEDNMEYEQVIKKPRIVSFDLEVSPALGYFYPPTWETGIIKAAERQKLMCFAWQIVGEKRIHGRTLFDTDTYKVDPKNDYLLAKELHEVMDSADILLGQNSDQFDVKMANYFFIMNGLSPIQPKKYIDTKKVAKKYFKFLNNTLDNMGEELGVGGKTKDTYKNLWVDAFLDGDKKAWKLMNEYCKNDVRVTTEIYLKMRGFMHSHPSLSRISNEYDACPRCGSYDYELKAYRSSNVSNYRQFYCNGCGGYFTDRKAVTPSQGDIKPKFVAA